MLAAGTRRARHPAVTGRPSRSARPPQIRPTPIPAPGVVAGDSGFRVAAYDIFGGTSGGIAGPSARTARRAAGLTHDESYFLRLNGDTIDEISVLWGDKPAADATVRHRR